MKYFLVTLLFLMVVVIEALFYWRMQALFNNPHKHAFIIGVGFLAFSVMINMSLIIASAKYIKEL